MHSTEARQILDKPGSLPNLYSLCHTQQSAAWS